MNPRTPKENPGETPIYLSIIGVAALLCFAFMLTGSFWMTLAVLLLGCLHLARYFPVADQIVQNDLALRWLRRLAPLIVIGIFAFQMIWSQLSR